MRGDELARTGGGIAAAVGGLLWTVKSLVVLVGGTQPPLVFEAAPFFLGLAVLGLARMAAVGHRVARATAVLGALAAVAGLVALASEAAGRLLGPVLALAMLLVLAGLVVAGAGERAAGRRTRPGSLALVIGLATVPAVLLGGAMATLDERLLEVPLLALGGLWLWLGGLVRRADVPAPSAEARTGTGR